MSNELFLKVRRIVSPVYLVGGPVRDELLGKEPKDYDFTTPLLPEAIETAIRNAGKKPYTIGKRFGTLGLKIDDQLIEITTFRTEKYAEGNRKPVVEFVADLTADLSRRDFTINAIARNETMLFDPFNGQEDLKNKLLRCVGKPSDRFKEDPLRMLRVARFASQLGFDIHEDTEDMCKQLNYKILEISKERWVMELDKILTSDNPTIGLEFLMRTRLMNYILPEISIQKDYNQNSPYHSLSLWEHTKRVIINTFNDSELRWAALLHDIGKPFVRTENKNGHSNYLKHELLGKEIVLRLATYLKFSNERKDNLVNLVLNHMDDNSPLRKADREAK